MSEWRSEVDEGVKSWFLTLVFFFWESLERKRRRGVVMLIWCDHEELVEDCTVPVSHVLTGASVGLTISGLGFQGALL